MIQIDPRHLRDALADLVRIPSINPDLVPGAGGEREIAEAIAARLRATPGITVECKTPGMDGRTSSPPSARARDGGSCSTATWIRSASPG